MRTTLGLLVLAAAAAAQGPGRFLDEYFKGEIVRIEGRRITIRYDFSHPDQLQDFERASPEGLFEKDARGSAEIEDGRLVLQRHCAVLHRVVARGDLRARVRLQVHLKRDCGLLVDGGGSGFLLLDLFDHRFRAHAGMLLGAFTSAKPPKWHEISSSQPEETGQFFGRDNVVEVELARRGRRESVRIEGFHRHRSSEHKAKEMARRRFGFWVGRGALSIDALTLTVEPDEEYLKSRNLKLALSSDPPYAAHKEGKLYRIALERPLSAQAAAARRELSRRGPDGWERLFKLARALGRKQAYAALPAVASLAGGREPERRELLLQLARGRFPDDFKLAVLRGLLRWYPQDAERIHGGLRLAVRERRELMRELALLEAPEEVFKALTDDNLLAAEAWSILKDRGAQLGEKDLGNLPRLRAREAHSAAAARAILEEFAAAPNWALVKGLMRLLDDPDARVARGAHMLLMTLSGKDLPPDRDLWTSWLTAKRASYEAPPLSAPGVVTAAIMRGAEFLRKDLLDDGACAWPVSPDWPGTRVGATALAVVALRATGVPPDDPAIRKALEETLLVEGALRGDLERYTYALSLLTMALQSVDAKKHRPLIEVLAKRLAEGQLQNGQWTYHCKGEKEYATLKRRPKAGDNSNTQYAVLALRAARLAGVGVPETVWVRNARYWVNTMNAWGGWGYGPKGTTQHELSMTSAGVATFAICMEALHGVEAFQRVKNAKRVKAGMQRLGELLLVKGYRGEEYYAFYGVERACILTATRFFNDFDWYHEGAKILIEKQKESGAWGDPLARGIASGQGYGEAIDTAYALLFLKRATTALPGAGSGGVVKVKYVRPQTVGGNK